MSQSEASELVNDLLQLVEDGFTIVSWNGLSFDFDILAEESGRFDDCVDLALCHIDMMFHAICVLGHRMSLAKAAEGMGLPGKSAGMTGSQAPSFWAGGRHKEVLKYVGQDAKLTLDLALAAERNGSLCWITGRGARRAMPLDAGWLPVRECCELPLPDTSWMDDPPPRETFMAWLG